jgi:hypothetical protein
MTDPEAELDTLVAAIADGDRDIDRELLLTVHDRMDLLAEDYGTHRQVTGGLGPSNARIRAFQPSVLEPETV